MTWVGRTRIDAEASWRDGVTEVPLGEVMEKYAVEVVDSGTVAHTGGNHRGCPADKKIIKYEIM